ncbi:SDR family NAD(P)-dependent oxidoreductase [Gordonia paraffinivorans]|uniref:SDR family NAD(P)-dependent oxidoreductase n=1 Tax=Gordonia paraffinivorans TaxID=175628 RepID=UPI001E60B250|nr:SDR family NAD(P)-dependent oxidoreductase [Gordonia paraffinivorans]MCD2146988.1 SDR family NAD(P)-dependent oxidoreductase [Gordonia paraffinivorans]
MPWYPRVTDERLRRLCGGRPAVVTGAGSGMGRELAHRLSAAGVRVLVSDIDDAALGETVTSSPGGGAPLVAAGLDVADADAVAAYVHDVVGREGPPALVLNNAGITMVAGVHEEDDRHARRIMAVNFGGVVNGTTAFLPHLEAAGGGHIVNTSSAFGLLGAPAQSAYSASKFAVRGFSESVQKQLRDNGSPVRIHVVCPGAVHTAIARRARYVDPAVRDFVTRGFDHRLPGTRPRAAAAAILSGVVAGRDRILVGPDARALDIGVRVFAGALQRPLATITGPVFRRMIVA